MAEHDVTNLLSAWKEGDQRALEELMPLIVDDLRRQAEVYLRWERPGHTLQATALVNEVYMRLVEQKEIDWKDRSHFFAVAAKTMRWILVDYARAHRAGKRGGWIEKVQLDEARDVVQEGAVDLVALDDALKTLSTLDPRQGQIVELRFFGGLTIDETAEVLGVAQATVSRDWRNAKAWLQHELELL